MRVLVVNAGSSSLKLRLLDPDDRVSAARDLPAGEGRFDVRAIEEFVQGLEGVQAVGHRVVHGGGAFTDSVRIDARVEERLRALVDLAPLHLPANLAVLDAVGHLLPDVPAVACFDTSFHARMPAEAYTYALPSEWRERWGLRRYGFHGLSHAYAARRAAQLLGQPLSDLRVVTCHLGAGASLAAIRGGVSIDTTMGFTPLEGLVMATRCGSIDPGLILWLQQSARLSASVIGEALEHRSGLLGLAGSGEMEAVLGAAEAGDPRARLALGVYLHRLRAAVAAMAAALGGLDVLVFTGGVGENASAIRAGAAAGLGFLGVVVNERRNVDVVGKDSDITAPGAGVHTLVITAREDLEIAHEVRRALAPGNGGRRPPASTAM